MRLYHALLCSLLSLTISYGQKSNYTAESHQIPEVFTDGPLADQINAGASIQNTFYFFYTVNKHFGQSAFKVQNDGSIIEAQGGFPCPDRTDGYFSPVLFDKKLYLFNLSLNSLSYHAMGPNGEDLGGRSISLPHGGTPEGLAAVAVEDEIFVFYHDEDTDRYPGEYRRHYLKCISSKDLKTWTESWIDKGDYVPRGAVKATAYYAKDGSRRIMVTSNLWDSPSGATYDHPVTNNKGLGCYTITLDRLRKFSYNSDLQPSFFNIDPNSLSGFGILDGSVSGAGTGDMVQLFYATKGSLYDHGNKVYRMEYSSKTETWSQPELLNFQMNAEYDRLDNCQPAVFPAYQTVGNDRKKQVLFGYVKNVRNTKNDPFNPQPRNLYYLQLARWDSDVLRFDSTYVEENPDPQLCTLIGVVEGPPPYILNGKSWERLEDFYDASRISYGTSSSQINENSSSWGVGFEVSVGFGDESKREGKSGWFDIAGNWKWDRNTTNSYSTTVSQEKEIFPIKGGNNAYQLWIKPIIQRDRFKLYDWKGNDLDRHVYFFKVTKSILDWDIAKMDSIDGAPRTTDFGSFSNRKYDPGNYPQLWSANISWQEGSSQTNSLKKERATTYESSFTQHYELKFGVNLKLFHVGGNVEGDVSLKSSTTSSISQDLTVTLNSPSGDPDDGITDTTKFAGYFYWIKPSGSLRNWWIPKGFENQAPWCMTYKITQVNGLQVGSRLATSVNPSTSEIPVTFSLKQNYPNPFNPLTRIEYSIPRSEFITLKVYSVLGEEVATLLADHLSPGTYVMTWQPNKISSGMYFYELRAGGLRETKKMLLCK